MNKPMTFAERMAALKGSSSTPPLPEAEAPKEGEVEVKEEQVRKEVGEVGRVILLANEASKLEEKAQAKATEGELLSKEIPDSAYILKSRIAQLQSYDGIDLRREMDDLRTLLLANPDACMFLLPEDTGLLVRALRKITDNKISQDLSAVKPRASKRAAPAKPLTATDLEAALDEL